uniref:DUF3467 domain-containing protein n=1 Tax=Macrostomum lignano TaxID=282301 RepID=A0A1I8G557_9PLAT
MLDALLMAEFQTMCNRTGRDYQVKGRPTGGTKVSIIECIEPLIIDAMSSTQMTDAAVGARIGRYLRDANQRLGRRIEVEL